ncbi:hypothetical protein [Falsochrobactrum shanghaiense]|uniref:hypothetical protein n=1 Tax=Falsochrobactrum shanghaiense TaxID=2201899 RepID=UPI0011B21CC8|nr:hypothetical protein [Falsochrobactrum shanghaiense]
MNRISRDWRRHGIVEGCASKQPIVGIIRGCGIAFAGQPAAETGSMAQPVDNFQGPHSGFLRCSSHRKRLMATTFFHYFSEAEKAGDIRDLGKNAVLGSFFILDPCGAFEILQ